MSNSIIAYEIMPSLNHLNSFPEDPLDREYGEAEDYDALIHKPTKPKDLSWGGMTGTIPYPGLEPVNFVGFLDRLPHQTDFLSTDYFEPIVSKRMLYVLRSVGGFPHKAISTRIYDYSFQDQGEGSYGRHDYEGPAIAPGGEFNEDYVGLQLLEHIDGIDLDSCKYEDKYPGILPPLLKTSWVMKEPIGGFPPVFRLNKSGASVYLFVSPAAKEALEEADIKGIRFFPRKGIRAKEMSSISN
jgi:hypothetical protein